MFRFRRMKRKRRIWVGLKMLGIIVIWKKWFRIFILVRIRKIWLVRIKGMEIAHILKRYWRKRKRIWRRFRVSWEGLMWVILINTLKLIMKNSIICRIRLRRRNIFVLIKKNNKTRFSFSKLTRNFYIENCDVLFLFFKFFCFKKKN